MLTLAILLSLPYVQTKLGAMATNSLNKKYKTNINVEQLSVTVFGNVKLKKVMIRDHHKDTLIYAKRIQTDILGYRKLLAADLLFGDISIDSLFFNLKTYKSEKKSNLNVFIERFEDKKKKSTKKFLLTAKNAYIKNSHFKISDDNKVKVVNEDFKELNISLNNFKIFGPDISAKINKMAFTEVNNLVVKDVSAQFTYTKKNILLRDMILETKNSKIDADVALRYKIEDFQDFNNKVIFDFKIKSSSIGTEDVFCFYQDIGRNKKIDLKSHIYGTLNHLDFKNLYLNDQNNLNINGEIIFDNIFGNDNQKFKLDGNFKNLSTNYDGLVALAPKVLQPKLPENLKKLGNIVIKGKAVLTKKDFNGDISISTAIGNAKTNLAIFNIDAIKKAYYKGNVVLDNFDLGKFIANKDFGKTSLKMDIDGAGFSKKNINTKANGVVSKFFYNQYSYSQLSIDGVFRSPVFEGRVKSNDPNLKMDFDGLVDIRQADTKLNFKTKIDFADLRKLNFIKDSLSIFKGDINIDVKGNNIDNLSGVAQVLNTSYQNKKNTYEFKDFLLTSTFSNNRERTITIDSKDIIEGKLVGKFKFNQLQKMAENAAGSLYANYSPNKIKKGQYLKFNFSIYNKIIEIFYPGIEVGANTIVSGNINSDLDEFKLKFDSPKISAFENYFDKVKIDIDNKNPLYNAYIEMDSIKTKQYKLSSFSLINVTAKDTLFVRSEFKGGSQAQDYYNLNLYHTIDKDNNSVVGIKKSELKFKDYLWFLNEEDASENKIVFDKKFKNFKFQNIMLTHEKQKITLVGETKGATYKDIKLDFNEVNLGKILPSLDNLKVAGNLNGSINFKQNNNVYQPTSSIKVDSLNINNIALGKLNLDIAGDNAFKKFEVNANIQSQDIETLTTTGNFAVDKANTFLDLDVRMNKFDLSILSPFGKDVVSNIRGFITGGTTISGNITKPNIDGRLYLEKAGLKIPYLNADYDFKENAIIDLSDNRFIFQNATLIDTKYKTEGKINGTIGHKNFTKWKLDLIIDSNRLLALDTKDSEDAAYFGTAFIDGRATIKGPTDGLVIAVDAKSGKGTDIKIPINNSESTSNKNFIHFLSPKEKFNLQNGIVNEQRNYNGLELRFDLNITPDAEIEVILDRSTGHGMKAKGNGTLLLEINTLGKFKMTGDYSVDKGTYNFKYKGVIDKKFDVKPNSSISWEGDPLKARLNLEAIYKLPTGANPSVLLDNPSINRKVDVEVSIAIAGNLSNPEPDFNINFPTVSSTLKSEIQTKLNDPIIRQTQALTLLGTGGFSSPEGLNQNTVYNNLFETAGDLFSGIFQNADDKVKIGLVVSTADRTPNRESNGTVGVSFNSQINERMSVNGKVGVPVGGVNQSGIVGNVEVLYRVNDDGTLNLRAFNRENDINYIGEGIGYTQGLGINYQVDFDNLTELFNKIIKKKKVTIAKKTSEDLPDSELPENVIFTDNKKKKNKELIPPKIEVVPPSKEE